MLSHSAKPFVPSSLQTPKPQVSVEIKKLQTSVMIMKYHECECEANINISNFLIAQRNGIPDVVIRGYLQNAVALLTKASEFRVLATSATWANKRHNVRQDLVDGIAKQLVNQLSASAQTGEPIVLQLNKQHEHELYIVSGCNDVFCGRRTHDEHLVKSVAYCAQLCTDICGVALRNISKRSLVTVADKYTQLVRYAAAYGFDPLLIESFTQAITASKPCLAPGECKPFDVVYYNAVASSATALFNYISNF